MTPTTAEFVRTLQQTPPLALALQQSLQRVKGDLDGIIKVLGYTKAVADKLDTLDNTLTAVSELLSVVSVVPEVGEAASVLRQGISVMSTQVAPARRAADQLEARVKPFREALQRLDQPLASAIDLTGRINTTSQTFLAKFTAVAQCVDSLPDGAFKQQAEAYLDGFSRQFQPVVSALNTGLSSANTAISAFYSALSALKQALNPLQAIADAADKVLNVLRPLMGPLQALRDALKNMQILIPLPYPHMVSLYDVFRTLGGFIDKAMEPIRGLVDDVLRALHITLPLLPDLSNLINLHIDIPEIPDLTLPAVANPFAQLNVGIPQFSLTCPPAPGAVAPVWPPRT